MSTIRLAGVRVDVPVLSGRDVIDKTLLADLDLELAERRIAVIGANGSGKSTLLRLLNGLIEPTSGTVTVDGLDTVRDGKQVRGRVGFIFTDPLSQLVMSTPIEDIELSLRRRVRGRREREAAAYSLLETRGLAHLARQSIYDLSGGERQLVALTAVLAVEPAILVADEPTTLLDLRNREQLRRVFAELDQQLVVSSHDLDFVADFDRALVVDAGRIVFDGAPAAAVAHYRGLMV
ncbi:energy-coupling factor ABC transporter ATP-binding protein [Granulicoccus sp. GXG6511]|uniref:energy-coupling factor ABC transporter ATP-binding protein n=1 Tax=Granulicoccus sp. GXG6511 TaxID=3381351 RepID=UPI003D7D7CE6